ncbi:MAG: prolipoprotein diacylglyceryl transferase [Chloroflexi bacterium]|nr:prolipoprotein diacylglyceryl transferase [Chloroflexota bacterium]
MAFALLAPLGLAFVRSRDQRLFSAALFIAGSAMLAGRAAYVLIHWEYFSEHRAEVIGFAGLSEHGAIAGGMAAYLILRRAVHPPPAHLGSVCLAAFVLVAIAASLGCIEAGCAYGREVFWQTDGEASLAWQMRVDWPDAYQVRNPRWPTQVLMAAWMAGCGTVLWLAKVRVPEVLVPCFAIGDFGWQFLRGDSAALLGPFRIYQWLDLVFIAISVLKVIIFMSRPKRVTLSSR